MAVKGIKLHGVSHGERRGYDAGCRCADCREANAAKNRNFVKAKKLRDPSWDHNASRKRKR